MTDHILQLENFYKTQKKYLFKLETDKIKRAIKEKNITVKILALNMNIKECTLIALLHQVTFNLELLNKVKGYLEIK